VRVKNRKSNEWSQKRKGIEEANKKGESLKGQEEDTLHVQGKREDVKGEKERLKGEMRRSRRERETRRKGMVGRGIM